MQSLSKINLQIDTDNANKIAYNNCIQVSEYTIALCGANKKI